MNEIEFKKALQIIGLELNDKMLFQLKQYLELLQSYNKVMNLTAIDSEEDIYEKHFYDCLLIAPFLASKPCLNIADIGSGAGFPGIPLAIYFKDKIFTLIEPLNKRANFLKVVIETLNLQNVKIIAKRSEDLGKDYKESFDIVTARAVAKLPILLELAIPLVKVGGYFIALKGKNALEELEASNNALKILNAKIVDRQQSFLPTNGDERNNLIILKNSKTDDKYPRNYSKIKKMPL